MKTKVCTKCNKEKSLTEFRKCKSFDDGYHYQCKECSVQERILDKKLHPWRYVLYAIKPRCNNKNHDHYKYYGGRGIKCLITESDVKELWFRDKAYEMKKPTIDRENNNGNYEFSNCSFIELSKNVAKRNIEYFYKKRTQNDTK